MPRRPSDGDEKKKVREARRSDADTSRRRFPIAEPTTPQYRKEEELAIFTQVFRGRDDVYPVRWENARRGTSGYMPDCSNKFVESVCHIKTTKCGQCPNQAFKKLDERAIEKHLQGHHTVGVYPLLVDGTCWFLALDFDDRTWRADVRAVRDSCTQLALPVYVERSRSGRGAHVWLFFFGAGTRRGCTSAGTPGPFGSEGGQAVLWARSTGDAGGKRRRDRGWHNRPGSVHESSLVDSMCCPQASVGMRCA